MKFWDFSDAKILRQLIYAMFITNNHVSLHFWWKENFTGYQKKFQNVMAMIAVTLKKTVIFFFKNKNQKLMKWSKIITQQPKTIKNPKLLT